MTSSIHDRSDQELLRAHVEGDPEAFGALVARHRDRLWAVALRTMGNPEDAADGLQDGLVAAFRRAETFRAESAVTTWLHRVVVNACLDRIRASRVRAADAWPEDAEPTLPADAAARAADQDPARLAEAGERRAAVLSALRRLPEEQRAAVVLVDMEGYSVAEAAEILACAVGTVKSRCSRGRSRLAELLGLLAPSAEDPPSARNPAPSAPVRPGDGPRGPPS